MIVNRYLFAGLLGIAVIAQPTDAAIRYVSSTTGSDTSGDLVPTPNLCLSAISPCATLNHAIARAAVDDTVYLAGEFEDSVLDKPLNLVGRRLGTIFAPFPACEGDQCPNLTSSSTFSPALGVDINGFPANNATLESVNFENVQIDAQSDIGALYLQSGELSVSHTRFIENGRAVAVSGGRLSVTDSQFSNNGNLVLDEGGGAILINDSHLIIETTVFEGNAARLGGAIWFDSGTSITLTILDSTFADNLADGAGAIFMRGGTPTIERCQFTGNQAQGNGGAIFAGSSITLRDSDFARNTAQGGGGAIVVNDAESVTMSGLEFTRNVAGQAGAALNIQSVFGVSEIIDIIVTDNRVEVEPSETEGRGGGIFLFNNANLSLTRAMISGNSVNAAGNQTVSGGAIAIESGGITIHDSLIEGNVLASGIGSARGSGIYAAGRLELSRSTLANNRTTVFGDPNTVVGGSGIVVDAISPSRVLDSMIFGHIDGIRGNSGSEVWVERSTLLDNDRALNLSGAFTIINSTLSGNQTALLVDGIDSPQALIQSTLADPDPITPAIDQSLAPTAQITLQDSIVLGRCAGILNVAIQSGRNIFNDSSCDLNTTAVQVIEPLADNGGPTLTHALTDDSPALDAGRLRCLLMPETTVDQRGIERAAQDDCDLGAYERSALDDSLIFADGFESS